MRGNNITHYMAHPHVKGMKATYGFEGYYFLTESKSVKKYSNKLVKPVN